jgi:hypothetical protein
MKFNYYLPFFLIESGNLQARIYKKSMPGGSGFLGRSKEDTMPCQSRTKVSRQRVGLEKKILTIPCLMLVWKGSITGLLKKKAIAIYQI